MWVYTNLAQVAVQMQSTRLLTDEEFFRYGEAEHALLSNSIIIASVIAVISIGVVMYKVNKKTPLRIASSITWINKNAMKFFLITAILFCFWMFRYEVTPTLPHQCLDRWAGEVVSC